MSWDTLMAEARKKQGKTTPVAVSTSKSTSSNKNTESGNSTKWDSLIADARRKQTEKRAAEYQKYIQSDEYKFAKENESRLKSGLGYNVNNGQIYTFNGVTKDSLQKSIAWADSEIEKLKAQGGHSTKVGEWTDKLLTYAGYGDKTKDRFSEADNITESSARLRELESQRAVYTKYLDSMLKSEDLKKIKSDVLAENKFGAIFNIDNEQKLYFLNAGEEGYSSDSYFERKDKKEQLKAELQSMGYDDIDRYIENYAEYRSGKTIEPILEYIEKGIVKSPVAGGALATVANIVTSPMRGVGQAFDNITGALGIHGYSAASLPAQVSETTKAAVDEVIKNNISNEYVADLVSGAYGGIVSALESTAIGTGFDKMGEFVLSLSSATSAYKEAKDRGLSESKALAAGVTAGIFEALFEHMSLENLRAFKASPAANLKSYIGNILKQSFTEGMEEVSTDIANEAYDYLINGGLSQYEQALRSGMTPKEYGEQFAYQLGMTFFGGAIAGGGMVGVAGAPSAVSGSIAESDRVGNVGKSIKDLEITGQVLQDVKKQGGITGKKAAYIEKQIAAGESVSDKAIGKIALKTTKQMRTEALDDILSGEEYGTLATKEKNAIRSSVLTFFNNPMKLDDLQRDVLQTENGKSVLKGVYEWQKAELDKKVETVEEEKKDNIRAALTEGNTEALVKNTFEAVTADGHTVAAGAVRDIVDGELEIVQDRATGATAKLSQLKIQDEYAGKLYNALQRAATGNSPMTADAMNVAIAMYNRNENNDPEAYISWAHDAYKAGCLIKDSTVLSFSEFEKMFEDGYSGDITRAQLYSMYEAGAKNLELKPGVTIIGAAGVTKQQSEQLFIINEVARKSGLQVVVINGELTDADGKDVNGLYKAGTNRIVLSLKNENDLILTHAGHEMFHWAKEQGEQWGEFLQDTVINVLKSDSKYDFEGIYRETAEAYEGCSEAEILEEIAAQYLGVAFSGENNIRRIVDEASAEERSFLKKLIARLKEFLDDIKQRMKLYASTDKTVRAAVETPVEQLDYIADMFMKALTEAGKTKKPTESDGGVKLSLQKSDIEAIQSFGERKSVNDFSSEEIEKTKVIAAILYADIGAKSPFFRAWFGDWREYDTTPVVVADKKGKSRGLTVNTDTGWDIQVSRKVFAETISHKLLDINIDAVPFLEYTNDIVEKAVLLDTFTLNELKSENSLFMHTFYAVADIGNGPELIKLYVEEMNNPNSDATGKRAYQLQNIEKQQITVTGSQSDSASRIMQSAAINTVSDLFKVVKSKDGNFNPNPVNPAFLNDDGTPKIFYHGTKAEFTVFDRSKRTRKVSLNVMGDGNYFTIRRQGAERYGENVIEAYLKAEKPYIFRSSEFVVVAMQIADEFGLEEGIKGSDVQQFLKEKGYDSVVLLENDKAVVVNVFNSEQIKSASDNIGTFDKTKKDIRYSRSRKKEEKDSVKSKKTWYNEFATNRMIWANSESTPVGSVLRQEIKGKVQFFLKTETGVLSIDKYEYKKIVSKENEYVRELNIIRKRNADTDNGIYTDSGRRSSGNVYADGYTGDAKRRTIADEGFAEKEPESGDIRDMANNRQYNSDISKDKSSTLQSQESEYKKSRQLLSYVEDSIDQLKAENYSFGEYVDQLCDDIDSKISGRRSPGSSAIFNREEFLNIASRYNTFYKKNEHGGYNQQRYSDREIANVIESVLMGISEGYIDARKGIITLAKIQVDILSDGYIIEDDARAKEFRKFVRNKPIYLSARDYASLIDAYGGTKKKLRAASFHQLSFKEAENGQSADIAIFYETARKLFPEFLKDVDSPLEMAAELIGAEKSLRPMVHYASEQLGFSGELEMREAAIRRAADILREAFNVETMQGDFVEQYKELIAARKSYDKIKQHNKQLLANASKSYYEAEKRETTYKRIIRNTKRLDDMLRNETDQRHIPEELKTPIAKLLSIIAPATEKRNGKSDYNSFSTIDSLLTAYKAYGIEDEMHFDEDIAGNLDKLKYIINDDVNIKKLPYEALVIIDDVVKHFSHLVKTGNDMFVNGRREKFAKLAIASLNEIEARGKKAELPAESFLYGKEYDMLTPIYFFKLIGTSTENGQVKDEVLFRMYRDIRDGQDKWYRNIKTSRELLADIQKQHNYTEAWRRELIEFNLVSGAKIRLTPEEIMYMRALNIRETGHADRLCHLLEGGIIIESTGRIERFKEKKLIFDETMRQKKEIKENGKLSEQNIQNALKQDLTNEDLLKIFATLTEDQIGYSEALVKMLSTTGADLGNEVSRELYGIDKFKEKNYIPISVVEKFINFTVDNNGASSIRLKNRTFTKRTTKDANAPVYVRSITDIAGEHMQEMSMYNAMTVPIENLTRLYNYQKPMQESFSEEGEQQNKVGNSYQIIFESVFGERGSKYFENFLEDINGGNQIREKDMMSGMVSRFKKSAVTGSLSVAIQQPSAIARATALINPKYFVTKPYSEADYNELLEYCPVAGIKEIGRFDVGTGKTAAEWIIDRERTKLQKADDYLSYLPGWMDRRTWVYIWNAVKRETAAENRGLSQELILEKAAARFRDVIDYTQVYDSTLSRSGYMRRKGSLAKMATAFLAEPTLSYNMLRDGVVNAKGNKAQLKRSIGAFAGATLLNAILKTIITALRHDDDETNYFEVYLSELPQNFIEDIIIVNSLPVVKDLISIAQGYDVSRSDMTLFSNVWNAAKAVTKEGHTPTWDELFALFGSITAFTGIPLNNVMKDLTAVVKTVTGLTKSPDFSWQVLGQTIAEAFSGEKDDSVKLYRAILNENQEIVERYLDIDDKKVKEYVKQGYSEADALKKVMDNAESSFHTKVKKGLVSEDIRIEEAAQALLASDTEGYEALIEELVSCGFDRNDVKGAVDMFVSSMQEKTYSGSETKDKPLYSYDDLFRAIDSKNMTAAKKIFNSLTEGVSKETVQSNLKSEYADDIYKAIVRGNSPETKRLADMFEEFGYDYHYAVILGLRENDERVISAAEARYEGDTEEYERLKADIVADGFDENDVFNAIESETEKLAPKNTASASAPESSYLYEAADLKRYAVSYNLEATKKAIKNFKDNGKDNGDIRTSLTSAFKKIYIEAWQSKDADTCIKIREFLAACDVGYSSKNFSGWEKEANSK